ncbi:hypothetical protein NUW54_g10447 [Trametes sanguinea]|uniref:Uncharacterized protein n=1 Tax=Trametes sanguinea TaxID=158606 RepID=A0ACC1P192_9APHY|nr:hypothetical protein NUW54_g10447 [Trametes sanguinea]
MVTTRTRRGQRCIRRTWTYNLPDGLGVARPPIVDRGSSALCSRQASVPLSGLGTAQGHPRTTYTLSRTASTARLFPSLYIPDIGHERDDLENPWWDGLD